MSITALLPILMAVSPITEAPPLPADLRQVEEAQWTRAPRANDITSRKAEKIMRANGCTPMTPTDTWEGVKIVVLMLVDGNGRVRRLTPVANGCEAVEEYGAKQLAKHLGKFNSHPAGSGLSWYRAKIIYSW
ncbi:MAG: hypothetical protein V3V15_10280 [Sphingorhabdus sp.]